MSKPLAGILLLLGALYLVGNGSVQLWDRDEPRYAQTSRQMLAGGDWVIPWYLDAPRLKKPPMVYWCQAGAMAVFGNEVFAARLPSAIAMILTLALVGIVVWRIAGPQLGLWTVIIFGTSGLAIVAAKMCLTDALLLLFVTASQFCLYAIWRGNRGWPVIGALGVSLGLAALTKGPVVLGVNATTFAVLGILRWWDHHQLRREARRRGFEVVTPADLPAGHDFNAPDQPDSGPGQRRAGWAGWLARIAAVAAIMTLFVLPWVLAVERRMPGAIFATLNREVGQRMVEAAEQHKGPPGYYLLFSLASFFPWCLFMFTALKLGWMERREPLARFSLAAIAGPWILFELIRTKLPHYVLPCFPFLAILTARALLGAIRGWHREWTGRLWELSLNVFALAMMGIGLLPWAAALPGLKFQGLPFGAMATVTATCGLSAGVILGLLARRRYAAGAAAMAGSTVLIFALLFGWYLPRARFLHVSEDVGRCLRAAGAAAPGESMMIDYLEDSLPFYQGGSIQRQGKLTYLSSTPEDRWPRHTVLTREVWDKTPAPLRERLEVIGTFRGWAYADRMRIVEVLVVRKR